MFGISGEHLVILAIIVLIFGPKRLPELGNTLGKAIKNFKDSISGVEEARYRKIEESKHDEAQVVAGAAKDGAKTETKATGPEGSGSGTPQA